MDIYHKGLPVKITRRANDEMTHHGMSMADVIMVLDEGSEQSRSRRKRGTIERVMRIKGRSMKVVAVESFSHWSDEKVLLVIHVGDTRER